MQRLDFDHDLVCERSHLQRVAHVVLHTILFHRLLGTVRPACIDAFELSFPAIADAQVAALVRDRASELVAISASNTTVSVVVYFFQPSSKLWSKLDNKEPAELSAKAASGHPSYSVGHTAAQAASSLRTWTSPSTYHGWLAHAFASGAGQPSGTFIPPNPAVLAQEESEKHELRKAEEEAFERWTITFGLGRKQGERVVDSKDELEGFVQRVVDFVGDNKAHLPGISGALCSYPLRILVRAGL